MTIAKKILIVLVSIIALVAAIYFIQKFSPQYIERVQLKLAPGGNLIPAENFSLKDSADKNWSLTDLRGRIIVLTFWTSWNSNSVEEVKSLNDYAKNHAQNNVVVLAVNSQETKESVKAFEAKEKWSSVTVLSDSDGAVGEIYGITVLPLTVFIDASGLESAKITGPLSPREIDEKITSLQ
jgi:peroxiredoxin